MVNDFKNKLSSKLFGLVSVDDNKVREDIVRRLVNAESKIGSEILGTPLHGGRREFFMSPTHPNEWLWHEETLDGQKSMTVRYIISNTEGVLKSVNGASYQTVRGKELDNLMNAIKQYHGRVMNELYYSTRKQVA